MPTPHEEELWSVLFDGDEPEYGKAIDLIKKYPGENLIKAINENGLSLLMVATLSKPYPKEFASFILNHADFDLDYDFPELERSNLESLIFFCTPEYVEKFKSHPRMFNVQTKLGYELAKESLKSNETVLADAKNRKSGSEKIQALEAEIKNLKTILATLRDTTIRHAFATNNYLLFSRLEAAGASLGEPLLDGTYPAELLKEDPAMFNATVKLGYELANESYKCAFAKYEEKKKANPSANETKQAEASVKKLQAIRATILDKTKRHAISNDDAEIFKRIHATGVSPFDEFLDGTFPFMIIKPSTHPKIIHWSKTRMAEETPKISSNSSAFYKREDLLKQNRALEHAQSKALTDVHNRGVERVTEIADTFTAKI